MKLSIATNIPIEFHGEENGLRLLAEAGFDTVDWSFFIPGMQDRLLRVDYLEQAEHSKSLLEKYGLICNQSHAGFTFRYGMEMSTACPEYLFSCRCIEYAALLGAKDIVVHTIRTPEPDVDFVEYNLHFFKSLEPLCQKFGIRIGVENACGVKSVDQINRFCEALSPEHFVVCLDIGHANIGQNPAEYARAIAPGRLQSLHVHDNKGTSDDHMLPYLGAINWKEMIRCLIDCGYSGDFTMEAGKFLRAFPPELTLDALKLYFAVGSQLVRTFETMLMEVDHE